MDETTGRKIEIFAPFSAAIDLTKLILFQPFDLAKWFTIGFAAFLAFLGHSGGGFNYNRGFGSGKWNWKTWSTTQDSFGFTEGMPAWLVPLIVIAFVCILALVILLAWVSARGKFIFTDCIVRNRGAIAEPWNEFKREGNSYFLFSLLIMASWMVIAGIAATPLWIPLVLRGEPPGGIVLVLGFSFVGLVLVVAAVFVGLLKTFMIPVMYRRRCGATEGFHAALAAITAQLGPSLLYLIFSIVLYIAVAMVGCVATCVTCCIAAIPYLGTVILLPLYVFLMSYALLFVRQFGTDYDAWGNIVAVEPAASPIDPGAPERPPLQE